MKFYYLGDFDSNGKSELVNKDTVPDGDLDAAKSLVKTALPESYALNQTHPEYLMDNSVDFLDNSALTITFITEGAGYRNAFGYFIYSTSNPPKSIAEIRECYFIFPNASASGSGGTLNSGDRIKLPYEFDYGRKNSHDVIIPKSYIFPKGQSVGWILYPNGWTGSGVDQYIVPYTSLSALNPEKAPMLKVHTACFLVPHTDKLLMGFEDLRRDSTSCDNDFNDLVISIEIDTNAVSKNYVDLGEKDAEKDDPNIPSDYTIGYKKIFAKIDGYTVECVATLYIPRSAKLKTKKIYPVRMMTPTAYVKSIKVVPPVTIKDYSVGNRATTTNYVGKSIDSGFAWYDNSFIYTVGKNVTVDVNADDWTGIHFFRNFDQTARYNFSPYYGNKESD